LNYSPSKRASYVAATAAACVGSDQFRHRYRPLRRPGVFLGWEIRDVANDGDDSCAAFASHVLAVNGLLRRSRSTIGTMLESMDNRGWFSTEQAIIGGVALWGCRADVTPEGDNLGHSGICVGEDLYVSHSSIVRMPVTHTRALSDGRLPVAFFAHEALIDGSA
jgi:hypothetical protein